MKIHRFKLKYIFCLGLLLLFSEVYSQKFNCRIGKITVQYGLSHHTVKNITQDKLGFLWFGTEAGLNRYDGYQIRAYQKDDDDLNSLSDDMINTLYADSEGCLWIGASKSPLCKFDPVSELFTLYHFASDQETSLGLNQRVIVEDMNKNIWFCGNENNGLGTLNIKNGVSKVFFHDKDDVNSIAGNNALSLFADENNNIWIGTFNGFLDKYNITTDSFTHFNLSELNPEFKANSVVWEIFIDSSNNFWVSIDNGLYLFNEATMSFKKILKNPAPKTHFILGFINTIIEDRNNNVWFGTEKGLYVKLKDEDEVKYLADVPPFKSSIATKNILSLAEDKSGIIWAAAYGNEVYKIDFNIKAFDSKYMIKEQEDESQKILVRSIIVDADSNLWIGTIRDGVFVYQGDKLLANFKSSFTSNNELNNNVVNNIRQLSNGEIWLATDGGGINVVDDFNKYQASKTKFRYHINNKKNKRSVGSDNVTGVYEDRLGRTWVGYSTGIALYDTQKNTFFNISYIPQIKDHLREVQSNCILHEKDNIFWVGTWNGLVRMVLTFNNDSVYVDDAILFTKKEKKEFGLSDKRITALHLDEQQNLWIGTYGGGLNKLDLKLLGGNEDLKIRKFRKKDGLISNEILGVQADSSGNLWMSTNLGLSKFNVKQESFENFGESDGLISDNFFWGASYKDKNGKIYFGQVGGVISFRPENLTYSSYKPPVVFTKFTVKNKIALKGSPKKFLDDDIETGLNYIDEIVLDYFFETFTVEFAAIQYSTPRKTKFKYILEGYNTEWIETDANHRNATYTNLNPGEYFFKVRSTNNDGIWVENEKMIKIIILKPFWEKWWFYLIEALIVLTIVISIIKLRERKLTNEKSILEDTVRERTRQLMVQNEEISQQNEEIMTHNEEISAQKELLETQKSKILKQNKEILEHKEHLEQKIKDRTTDLEKAKDDAERADRLKTSFLENLSHEIRTPLNAIVGFTGLLSKSLNPDGKEANYIKYISTSSNTLLEIINSIVQISKIQLGEFQVSNSKFLLNDFLQHLFNEFSLANEANKSSDVKLILNIHNMVPGTILNTDLEAMRLVMYHLIGNALKFTEEGVVEFGVLSQSMKTIELFVKDTGIGISEEDVKNIFEKFRKVETDKGKLYRGLGLGLTIAKSVTQKLGGKIWLESEKGKGSAFFVSLPLS